MKNKCSICGDSFTPPDINKQRKTCSSGCSKKLQRVTLGRYPSESHGYTGTRVHDIWRDMLKRCTTHPDYKGRGISVCESWQQFENFLADMGEPPKDLTLDRINNDGNYEPGNCRWATRKQQAQNRRSTRLLTFQGQTLCLTEWARRLGIKQPTLSYRIKQGWSVERALSTPVL